jgi:heat shock protein HtpX
MNQAKTVFLLVLLTGLLLGLGWAFGGPTGIIIAFAFSLALNAWTYWFSDRMALAMSGAHQVSEQDDPELHRVVQEVADMARLPKPKVYVIQNDSPNAFATGRNPKHSAVAVTTGIRRILDRDELKAVLSHEMGHVRNRDILVSTIVATVAGAVMFLASIARWGLFFGFGGRRNNNGGGIIALVLWMVIIILAPIAALLIRMAISRSREYGADATGADICGRPMALASALRKLQMGANMRPMQVNESTAHLYIVNPLRSDFVGSLFSTHPPIEDRIARLEKMAQRMGVWG